MGDLFSGEKPDLFLHFQQDISDYVNYYGNQSVAAGIDHHQWNDWVLDFFKELIAEFKKIK